MGTGRMKEVYFGDYCQKCAFFKLSESEDPCWDCLKHPVNEHSHKPTRFVEGDQNERDSKRGTVDKNKRAKRRGKGSDRT